MTEITTQELKKIMDDNKRFILLDCRGVDYYNWEHLPHSVNLRWKYVSDRANKILKDKNALIITSCDGFTCNSSIRCFKSLKKLGYKNLVEYSGGLADWKAHGYPTVVNSNYRIAPNVYRFPDQVFYGEPVGSYLIETKEFILLVDGPQNLTDEHEDFIIHFGKPIKIFMSHGPTGGGAEMLQKKYKAKISLHKKDINNQWLSVKPDVLFEDGLEFNKHLKVISTPGHSPGSSVVYDKQNKIMFTGDNIQGNDKGGIYDFIKYDDGQSGNATERLESTRKLLKYDFDMILPFHYKMIIRHAKKRLDQFLKQYEK